MHKCRPLSASCLARHSHIPVHRERTTPWQGLFLTILLHSHHPWRSDGGGTSPRKDEVDSVGNTESRTASGIAVEDALERPINGSRCCWQFIRNRLQFAAP
jgi:hypothetical protein